MTTFSIVKSLHIISVIAWFAGLLYLPRLFVYHAQTEDEIGKARFKIMERKLFFGIMTPAAISTIFFGGWLWQEFGFRGGWLDTKLSLVSLLVIYHLWCGALLFAFKHDRNTHSHRWYRWFNELPMLALFGIVFMVVGKPF